jgi:glutathione synthase/RimK-type ligase-like ATP-grasp enzyme
VLLIVTNKQDVHSDEVIGRLGKRNVPVFRLNTEDVLTKYKLSLGVDAHGKWAGRITDELSRSVALEDLRVAWVRRPEFVFKSSDGPDAGVQKFIVSEVRALVACLYALPNITFVNEVFDADRAKTKFQQLILASKLGVRVPRTLMTNSASDARKFAEEAEGDLLIKVVHTGNVERAGVEEGLPSRKIARHEFLELCELVNNSPTQIQDYVEKDYELRVTVVGRHVFAVRIDSQINEATKVDWRPQTALNPHSLVSIPEEVAGFCRTFIEEQRLLYGAIDFIVDPKGRYVFLENNPSGQYLWLEHETGVPITEALVEMFIEQMTAPISGGMSRPAIHRE